MNKPVILTGLRANNDLHIGNYLGALLPIIDIARRHADDYQINLFVPDLHSFTTPIDHGQLQAGIMNNLRVFAAAGLPLDNPNIHIYRQSYIPAHSELTIILNSFTGFGEMSRMTQFKDKLDLRKIPSSQGESARQDSFSADPKNAFQQNHVSMGLFDYPVLMAADILLYGAIYVPVGDDQKQHLEFTRDIAERMNNKFGELFIVPKSAKEQHEFFGKDQGLRIRDLLDPAKKMSKSDASGKGVIFLNDTPEQAHKKIQSATTDSLGEIKYDYTTQPGISNLLDILELLGGRKHEFIGSKQYGPLKEAVAILTGQFLEDFQTKLEMVDTKALEQKLAMSETAMCKIAETILAKVQKAVGLRT